MKEDLDNFIVKAFRPTTYFGLVEDNWFRLFALGFLERLVTLRQGLAYTTSGFSQQGFKSTLTTTFNDLRGANLHRGLYRGTLLNFSQWSLTYGNAVVMSEGDATSFMVNLLALEALFHPFDTLRTRYTADGSGQYKTFVDALRGTNYTHIYRGFLYKMVWTAAVGGSLCSLANSSDKTVPYLMLAAAYPFLTCKTLCQVGYDSGSFAGNLAKDMGVLKNHLNVEGIRTLYRGALPYALLAGFAHWSFPQIWSEERKSSTFKELQKEWADKVKNLNEMGSRNHGL